MAILSFVVEQPSKDAEKKKSKADMFADTHDMFSDDYAVSIQMYIYICIMCKFSNKNVVSFSSLYKKIIMILQHASEITMKKKIDIFIKY